MPKLQDSYQAFETRSSTAVADKSGRIGARSSSTTKRSFDIASATASLIILLPIFLSVVVILLIAQGSPIFIRHKRVGQNGKTFYCLKFRTMVRDAEGLLAQHLATDAVARKEWESSRKLKNDPRVTSFGHVLRKSSIDELPQLLNIIKGDMSVVGPRPIVSDEMRYYGHQIRDYVAMRPGLTGLWQISGRSDASYRTRVDLDSRYAKSSTFIGDMKIIAHTIPAVLRGEGSY